MAPGNGKTKLFETGRMVMTRGISDLVAADAEFAKFIVLSLTRHKQGDWGIVNIGDQMLNDKALKDGDRLVSAYVHGQIKVYVITEADRSASTIMLAEEY